MAHIQTESESKNNMAVLVDSGGVLFREFHDPDGRPREKTSARINRTVSHTGDVVLGFSIEK